MIFALLLACFFLSGFSALRYETAWTREFAFVFGTSELAVVAVLAAYMGGLALGAAVAARLASRVRRAILAYGSLELAIALWALALPFAVRALRAVYLGWLGWLGGLDALPETLGLATHAFHLAGAFLVLMPCTMLMGATLPLLSRHAVTRDEQIGPRIGVRSATNTFGAIAGTLAAAFVLLPAFGLRQTVVIGAGVNLLVFATATVLSRRAPPRPELRRAPTIRGVPWIVPAIAVSGAVSFGYEVLRFRLLGYVLGASTAAFATMLASFLASIALGSAAAAPVARTRSAAAKGFAAAQIATAAAAGVGFAAVDRLPALADVVGASIDAPARGASIAAAVLVPLRLCVGATFPFAIRWLAARRSASVPPRRRTARRSRGATGCARPSLRGTGGLAAPPRRRPSADARRSRDRNRRARPGVGDARRAGGAALPAAGAVARRARPRSREVSASGRARTSRPGSRSFADVRASLDPGGVGSGVTRRGRDAA